MDTRWLPLLANCFVAAFALDAGLSLLEEGFRFATGSWLLAGPRNAFASLVVLSSLLCLPLLWLTPRLPLGLFLALIGSSLWFGTGAVPLPLVLGTGLSLELFCVGLQVVIAGAALLWIRWRNGGEGWLFAPDAFAARPIFSLRHTTSMSLAALFLLAPAALLYAVAALATFLQLGTSGFVSFDLSGVTLADRRYVQGDREVRLVGMMHIGEEAAYRELVESFVEAETIVLEEGVSDLHSLLQAPLSYDVAATAFGLEQQGDLRSYLADSESQLPEWPVLRNADVDLSEFSPVTLEWLSWVAEVWAGKQPLEVLREVIARSGANEDELATVEHDILALRNQHLLEEIDAALPDYRRVIVPWGALHLPFIEESILERGFDESQRRNRRLISWMTVVAALLQPDRDQAPPAP